MQLEIDERERGCFGIQSVVRLHLYALGLLFTLRIRQRTGGETRGISVPDASKRLLQEKNVQMFDNIT
jgi:hypothetical protein